MPSISVTFPENLRDEIDARLDVGENRSEWMRDAARVRLLLEKMEMWDGFAQRTNDSGDTTDPEATADAD